MTDDPNDIGNIAKLIEQNIMLLDEEATCLLKDYRNLLDTTLSEDDRCGGLFNACKHLENLARNVRTTYKAVIDHIAPPELLIELTRERLEQELGVPVVVDEVNIGGMVAYGFRQEQIVVPDDCSEIDGEEE